MFPATSRNCPSIVTAWSRTAVGHGTAAVPSSAIADQGVHVAPPSALERNSATPDPVGPSLAVVSATSVSAGRAYGAPPASAIVPLGATVSTTIASFAAADTLPASSRNCAYTVCEPSPASIVQEIDGSAAIHSDHTTPSLLA